MERGTGAGRAPPSCSSEPIMIPIPSACSGVVVAALVIRSAVVAAAFVFGGPDHFLDRTDSLGYLELASALVAGEGFVVPQNIVVEDDQSYPGEPELFRTPGYPFFVAVGVLAGFPVAVTIVLQIVLGALSAGLVYRIAQRVVPSETVAVVAGLLYAIDPVSVLHTTYVLSETLFTFVFLLHLMVVIRHFDAGDTRSAVLAGLLAALAALIRPVAFYWPLVAVLLVAARNIDSRRLAAILSVFALAAVGPLVAWKTRNGIQTGYWGYASVQEVNIYRWVGTSIKVETDGISWDDAKSALDSRLDDLASQNGWTRAERYQYMQHAGMELIAQNLGASVMVFGQSVWSVLMPSFSEYVRVIHARVTPVSGSSGIYCAGNPCRT